MRWACILLPQLALDGALRRCADPEAPLALVAGAQQRRVLHAVNPAARALGLRRGMGLAAAQALAGSFATLEHDPREQARWHQFLAAWAYRFSSQVSTQYGHALIVEIAGSLGASLVAAVRPQWSRLVVFLPAFWVLVPGSLGLLSVTSVGIDPEQGARTVVDVAAVICALALGLLFGSALAQAVTGRFERRSHPR